MNALALLMMATPPPPAPPPAADIALVNTASAAGGVSSVTFSSLTLTPGRYVVVFGGARSDAAQRSFSSMTHSAIDSQSAIDDHFEDGTTNDGYAWAREFEVVSEGTDDLVITLSGSLFGIPAALYRITNLGTIQSAKNGGESAGFTSFDVTGSPSGTPAMGLAASFARNSDSDADLEMTWTAEQATVTAGAYAGVAGVLKSSPGNSVTTSRVDGGNLLVGAGLILWFNSL